MSNLSKQVEINRRFARSARLDADLNGSPPLVGYVLQASVEKALITMASSQVEGKQGAFTWTGPYGGGKSSAALLLANIVAGRSDSRKIARKIAGETLTGQLDKAFPSEHGNWSIVAVTGARVALRQAVADACASAFDWPAEEHEQAATSNESLLAAMLTAATKGRSGALVILDELGKLLEHEALDGGDVHFLQDLAERSSRSNGRLVVIGILHQAFDQYAAKAGRGARDEWAKVQGRYQDIPFLAGADETVALLGRAISNGFVPYLAEAAASDVAQAVATRRPTDIDVLTNALVATWPLNPVTSLLLGPVSRQRFAQNERSVFGFLSSAEPFGFQEFLNGAGLSETYNPDRLWDYLASNFGMSLASGSDGSRFSLAFEAIERAAAKGTNLHVALTKSAAVIEFFRNGSGLALTDDFLAAATPYVDGAQRRAAIDDLLSWAILIRQPRLGGYALFAGSDFDLEEAIAKSTTSIEAGQLQALAQQIGLGFAIAKRHYFRTGTLRTFEIAVILASDSDSPVDLCGRVKSSRGRSAGVLALILGDGSLNATEIENRCKSVAKLLQKDGEVAAVGGIKDGFLLRSSAAELFAIDRVLREHPQLEGDRIARREVAARRSRTVDALHRDLESVLNSTRWWMAPSPTQSVKEPIAIVASALADASFPQAPVLQSELLQRDKPSSSAMAALRDLCYAMVLRNAEADLGFSGFPAAMGLYLTVLKSLGLHGMVRPGVFDFKAPSGTVHAKTLQPAWSVLEDATDIVLSDVYETWAKPPIGLKAGPMPILALAFLLASRERTAIYIDGVFQTEFNDVLVDRLLQKPADIRLRRIDRSLRQTAFMSGLAQRLKLADGSASLPIAQILFRRYEDLPLYAQRTDNIGDTAKKLRSVVLKSKDPEALLFENIPSVLSEYDGVDTVIAALEEVEAAYPALLRQLHTSLARSLAVDPRSFDGIRDRAESVKNLTNDYSFEAFVMRAAAFEGGCGDIEGIASLLLHKPSRNWSDRDREQALLQLARFGRQFRELEALAVVRDRGSSTEALALVVGVDPKVPPLLRTFVLTDAEKHQAKALADQLLGQLSQNEPLARIQFAALARAVASLAADTKVDNYEV
ncbi:ATP-binding protein [Rhizobium sp. WYCCWR 11279]|uniref:ATP-binding protein n=1 Tax=Rhizobium changzhiense TaxID=2692317 RepID=UPI001492A79D|nr:ATP-binding protein [Rhizobium changzhiense]NNU46285.1 ATP-binding protein [Rhizobium changzhiense]